MTKRSIKIVLTDEGNVILKNEIGTEVVVFLNQKQLEAKDIYDLLDYDSKAKYCLEGKVKYTDEEVSGPKNEKYRLYNYVHEYMDGLITKLSEYQN